MFLAAHIYILFYIIRRKVHVIFPFFWLSIMTEQKAASKGGLWEKHVQINENRLQNVGGKQDSTILNYFRKGPKA